MGVVGKLRKCGRVVVWGAAATLLLGTVGLVTPASAVDVLLTGQAAAASGPAEGVVVELYDLSGNEVDVTSTSDLGGYAFRNLAAGQYKIEFGDATNRYRLQYYGGAHGFSRAEVITYTGSDQDLPTITLTENPSIAGHLVNTGGQPIKDASLLAYDEHGDAYQTEVNPTGVDGAFRVWVDPGTYRLSGAASSLPPTGYFAGWYADAEGYGDATPITVRAGSSVSGLRFVLYSTLRSLARPTVSGTAAVGRTLSADRGRWTVRRFVDFTYQWQRGTKPIAGATRPTYTLKAADLGHRISVRVTGILDQPGITKLTAHKTSLATAAVVKGRFRGVKVTITGKHRVGHVLEGHASHAKGATVKYQWLRDGKRIKGKNATRTKYALTRRDAGHKVSVRATVTKRAYVTKVEKSKAVTVRR